MRRCGMRLRGGKDEEDLRLGHRDRSSIGIGPARRSIIER